MSVGLPDCKVYVGEQWNRDQFNPAQYNGGVQIPNEDMIKLRAHIAMMEEVSNFELALYNFDKQYIETYPIRNKDFVRIFIGRGAVLPQVFQGKVEEIDAESEAMYHEMTLKGRCIGEDLYRRLVTELFQNKKGEYIVRTLLDKYCSFLRHQRNGVELIEDTDTTYTEREHVQTKFKDVLDYIAKTADKAGVIGYDYRVEYDGLFAFFPRSSKTSPISLIDVIKYSNYRRTVHRIRNRIYVYGKAEKTNPLNPDDWTEELTDWSSTLQGVNYGTLSQADPFRGSHSIKVLKTDDFCGMRRTIPSVQGGFGGPEKYRYFEFAAMPHGNGTGPLDLSIHLGTPNYNVAPYRYASWGCPWGSLKPDEWNEIKLIIGPKEAYVRIGPARGIWWCTGVELPDWDGIREIVFILAQVGSTETSLRVDFARFSGARFSAVAENITDPADIREESETDEELASDAECLDRANALLDWLKDEAELVTLQTEILDFGNNRIQPGDMQPVVLPNENVNKSFRVLNIDYNLDEEQELPIAIELGKETPLLADYLYRLRKETSTLARLKAGI